MDKIETPVQTLILISGTVQGVFYRAHAQEEAENLGLTGSARNLPTGQVEILLQGPKDKIHAFIEWSRIGSPNAKVTDLKIKWQNFTKKRKKFEIF